MAVSNKQASKEKLGKIAFITTPQYRLAHKFEALKFVCENMYALCEIFDVISTGGTYDLIKQNLLDKKYNQCQDAGYCVNIKSSNGKTISDEQGFDNWKNKLINNITRYEQSFTGMINIIYELVEGRICALIHLTDWQDISAKPDSAVLAREANVHNVPVALNKETAEAFIKSWQNKISQGRRSTIFPKRKGIKKLDIKRLNNIEKKEVKGDVLAIISHDNKKIEMCRFVTSYAKLIFQKYDYVIATGTTGGWIKRFVEVTNGKRDADKVLCCFSGPLGGDLQIAHAVVTGLCRNIIFFQDPLVSHPHESDIRLFEQAVVADGVNVKMATNYESAKLLIQ